MLENIDSPKALKNLNAQQLGQLAEEIRQQIIETVRQNGGHLGANLGVVELTIALHTVLDTPEDKIVWDVGHQCYTHKLLTGRQQQFCTLRQWQGLSGYPKTCESVYDCWDVGHSSTSVSGAAGMVAARDLLGAKYKVVAVIGDGALTGGLAFEALNHMGQLRKDLVVVLNDNEMSIGKNVGALSDYLNRLRMDPTLARARGELEALVQRIPRIGQSMNRLANNVTDTLKGLLPGQLFQELGFHYTGPLDGHDIPLLQRSLTQAVERGGPVLVHILTQKGKGFEPAELDPDLYHGIGPMVAKEATKHAEQKDYSRTFGDQLCALASKNERVVAITAAMKAGTGLDGFARQFPDRFFDVGIAEQHALTLAAGMACAGLRPVVAIYSTFLQRAYDQVIHDICMPKRPVVLAVDRAGIVGDDGPTHHGVFDISFLRHVPNLTFLAPSSTGQLQQMMNWAFSHEGPIAIRYPRGHESFQDGDVEFVEDCRKSQVVAQGKDCLILAVGPMVKAAVEAAEILDAEIECAVVDIRCLKPLDRTGLLPLIRRCRKVVTVEDNIVAGGFGSAVAEMIAGESDVQILMLGYPDEFVPHGTIAVLHQTYGLDGTGIAKSIQKQFGDGAKEES